MKKPPEDNTKGGRAVWYKPLIKRLNSTMQPVKCQRVCGDFGAPKKEYPQISQSLKRGYPDISDTLKRNGNVANGDVTFYKTNKTKRKSLKSLKFRGFKPNVTFYKTNTNAKTLLFKRCQKPCKSLSKMMKNDGAKGGRIWLG